MNTQDNVMPIEEAKALKEASDAIGKVIADLEKNDSGLDKGRIRNSTRNLARIIENARLFQQSDLISELVHELRTPLTSLNTAARLMLRAPRLPPETSTVFLSGAKPNAS